MKSNVYTFPASCSARSIRQRFEFTNNFLVAGIYLSESLDCEKRWPPLKTLPNTPSGVAGWSEALGSTGSAAALFFHFFLYLNIFDPKNFRPPPSGAIFLTKKTSCIWYLWLFSCFLARRRRKKYSFSLKNAIPPLIFFIISKPKFFHPDFHT